MTIRQVTTQFLCLFPVWSMHAGCMFARRKLAQLLNAEAEPVIRQITVSSLTVMQPSEQMSTGKELLKKAFILWERGINVANHKLLSVTKVARCCVQRGAIKQMDCVCVVLFITTSHWWWKNQDLAIESGVRHSRLISPVEHLDVQPTGSGLEPKAFVLLERALWHVQWKIIQRCTITRSHAHKPDGSDNRAIAATSLEITEDNFLTHLNFPY